MKRYALQSLVEASGMSEAALARRVGLSGTTLKQARTHGLVESAADRYACRAGLVPWLVWPNWLDDAGKVCRECGAMFYPQRSDAMFCTKACGQRLRQRRYWSEKYASDPEFREREKARRRAYYAECSEYENAKSRERHRRRKEQAA